MDDSDECMESHGQDIEWKIIQCNGWNVQKKVKIWRKNVKKNKKIFRDPCCVLYYLDYASVKILISHFGDGYLSEKVSCLINGLL